MTSAKPVGNLTKLSKAPVGKIKKTSFAEVIDIKVKEAVKAVPPQEVIIREQAAPPPPVESKPELTKADVVDLIQQNNPEVDDLVARILQKLPPLGGGSSWSVKDMPGYKESLNGYVFGIKNKKAGFYDPLSLGIVGGGEEEVPYTRLIDTDGDFKYVGEANPGTAPSAASWRIKRIEFLAGDDIEIKWAAGTATFDKVWTNRASEDYS
jgi:hypothetical protein